MKDFLAKNWYTILGGLILLILAYNQIQMNTSAISAQKEDNLEDSRKDIEQDNRLLNLENRVTNVEQLIVGIKDDTFYIRNNMTQILTDHATIFTRLNYEN